MGKKKVKRFDVWVTRDHDGGEPKYDMVEVVSTIRTAITRRDGCCFFSHPRKKGYWRYDFVEDITIEECLERYGFLPRPGQCWNVWNTATGKINYQEHPVLEWDEGTLYKRVTHPEERKYYLVSPK